jgi:hypothetical protein
MANRRITRTLGKEAIGDNVTLTAIATMRVGGKLSLGGVWLQRSSQRKWELWQNDDDMSDLTTHHTASSAFAMLRDRQRELAVKQASPRCQTCREELGNLHHPDCVHDGLVVKADTLTVPLVRKSIVEPRWETRLNVRDLKHLANVRLENLRDRIYNVQAALRDDTKQLEFLLHEMENIADTVRGDVEYVLLTAIEKQKAGKA